MKQALDMRQVQPGEIDLIDYPSHLVLQAISRQGRQAVDAFKAWRALSSLDDADYNHHRAMPLLADLAVREGIDDPGVERMRGVGRHIWTRNTLKLRTLFVALDALEAQGIKPILLKGAALFARTPGMMSKRAVGDYDILVPPHQLHAAGEALARHGFDPGGYSFDDFGAPFINSPTAGIGLTLHGNEIDIHWRPLPNITNPELTSICFAGCEQHRLQGRDVLIPSLTHHLFMALARCEPWNAQECFTRLLEGFILLSSRDAQIDWDELATLVQRFGFEEAALAYLGVLTRDTGLRVPDGFTASISRSCSRDRRNEWRIRATPPENRSMKMRRLLEQHDLRSARIVNPMQPPGTIEALLRDHGRHRLTMRTLWGLAVQRTRLEASSAPRYLEGFSYPEKAGRWAVGHWAVMTVPLSAAQKAGEPVLIRASAFCPDGKPRRITAAGGYRTANQSVDAHGQPVLSLRVRPLPQLGGDGVIMFAMPGAISPLDAGLSQDRRQLGMFIQREWQGARA